MYLLLILHFIATLQSAIAQENSGYVCDTVRKQCRQCNESPESCLKSSINFASEGECKTFCKDPDLNIYWRCNSKANDCEQCATAGPLVNTSRQCFPGQDKYDSRDLCLSSSNTCSTEKPSYFCDTVRKQCRACVESERACNVNEISFRSLEECSKICIDSRFNVFWQCNDKNGCDQCVIEGPLLNTTWECLTVQDKYDTRESCLSLGACSNYSAPTGCNPESEELMNCGQPCSEPSCSNPTPVECTEDCVRGFCSCVHGFFRGDDGHCVPAKQCSPTNECHKQFFQAFTDVDSPAVGPPPGRFVPVCRPDGLFEMIQCSGSSGFCWCVNIVTGEEIAGTKVGPGQGPPSCGNKGYFCDSVRKSCRLCNESQTTCDRDGLTTFADLNKCTDFCKDISKNIYWRCNSKSLDCEQCALKGPLANTTKLCGPEEAKFDTREKCAGSKSCTPSIEWSCEISINPPICIDCSRFSCRTNTTRFANKDDCDQECQYVPM